MHGLVTCKNEEDQIENEGARLFTRFLQLLVYGDFSRRSRAAKSAVHSPIWSNFELQDFIVVLLTYKNEEDRSKMEALMCSQHYTSIFRRARADNSDVGDGIWPKFELIQAFMHVLLSCKNEVDQIKNEGAKVFTRFLPL